jgi:hypothetical protein
MTNGHNRPQKRFAEMIHHDKEIPGVIEPIFFPMSIFGSCDNKFVGPLTIMSENLFIQHTTCTLVRAICNPDTLYWNTASLEKLLPQRLVAFLLMLTISQGIVQ